jgi:uncharacterized membrane protein YedE/YeeE
VRETTGVALVGLSLGFALSRIGFSSWDEVHRMFTFADLRLFLTFCSSVAILLVAWWVIRRVTGATWSERRVHQGTIAGGVMFGAGWALTGACPSSAATGSTPSSTSATSAGPPRAAPTRETGGSRPGPAGRLDPRV